MGWRWEKVGKRRESHRDSGHHGIAVLGLHVEGRWVGTESRAPQKVSGLGPPQHGHAEP